MGENKENVMPTSQRPGQDFGPPSARPGWTAHFGIFALVLVVTMPRLVRSFSPSRDLLDTSWAWMLGYSLQHHLQWGRSIVFTYGPLGFLSRSYFYSDHVLWGLTATVRLASWLIFGLGFANILRRLVPGQKPFTATTVLVAIGWVAGACFLHLSDQSAVLGVLLLALAIAEEDGAAVTIELALSGSLLALGALVKSTALIVSLFALLAYPALWWYAGRRKSERLSLVPLLSFLVWFCALWSLSSQSFGNLPAYLRGTWAIVSGYTPAMSTPAMPYPVLALQTRSALLILGLLAGALIGLHVRRTSAGGARPRIAQCLLLGGVVFWAWKEGFTLQDPGYFRHPMTFFGTALLLASAGIVLLSNESSRKLKACIYAAYAVALVSVALGYPPSSLSYARVLDNYADYLALISSSSRRADEERSQDVAIREQLKIPDAALRAVGHASMNVLPWSLTAAQGYGMRLIASPVIQSYSAYTPYLDRLNARQIWDGRSADKIIYTYAALGLRYPAFDEPATFRAMLACYRTEYAGDPYAVLSRIACPSPEILPDGDAEQDTFGSWIRIPLNASYVRIDIRSSAIGEVRNILYKSNHVWVMFGLPDGHVKGPYLLTYPVARDGLFIRYFVGSQSQAAALFSGRPTGLQRIGAIRILAPRSWDYTQHFRVQFLDDGRLNRPPSGNAGEP